MFWVEVGPECNVVHNYAYFNLILILRFCGSINCLKPRCIALHYKILVLFNLRNCFSLSIRIYGNWALYYEQKLHCKSRFCSFIVERTTFKFIEVMETEKIPIPSKRSSKINQIIKQMRWKAFFDMKGSDDNTQKIYGLKSLNSHQKSTKWYRLKKIHGILQTN